MDTRDYKSVLKQYIETVDYVRALNTKLSELGNWEGKAAREAYVQQYEQRLSRFEVAHRHTESVESRAA